MPTRNTGRCAAVLDRAICRAKLAAAKAGAWRGPMWLNGPGDEHVLPLARGAHGELLLRELADGVGARGRERASSVSGSWSRGTRWPSPAPGSCAPRPSARSASSRWSVPITFTWSVDATACHDWPTWAAPARWKIVAGPELGERLPRQRRNRAVRRPATPRPRDGAERTPACRGAPSPRPWRPAPQQVEQVTADEACGAGHEHGSGHAQVRRRAVLLLVVRAEGGVLFLDRPPPPLVRRVPARRFCCRPRRSPPAAPSRAPAASRCRRSNAGRGPGRSGTGRIRVSGRSSEREDAAGEVDVARPRCRRRCCTPRRRCPRSISRSTARQWSSTCSQSRTLPPSPYSGTGNRSMALVMKSGMSFSGNW